MGIILGADSRYTVTIPEDTEYQFFGIKISDGAAGGPYSQPLTQWQRCGAIDRARLPFHFWRGPGNDDPIQDGHEQAHHFWETYVNRFMGYGETELPPVIDCEDSFSKPGLHALGSIVATLKATEDLWGIPPYTALVYSAGWWWDKHIKPYTTPDHEIYRWKLWEADPPPETPIGYWEISDSVITQRKLDFAKPGFSASIDEDIALADWYQKAIAGEPPQGELVVELRIPAGVRANVVKING